MSTPKVYEIAFKLGATINSSMRTAFANANKNLGDLNKNTDRAKTNFSKTNKSLADLNKNTDRSVKSTGFLKNSLGSLKGPLIGIAGAAAAASAALSGIGKAMDFESQLSSIQALTGASGKEMKQMSDLALEMGSKTKYSALEAAQGIEELLKAGITPAQVKAGSLEAALNLATAGGLDLAKASEIMSTALNAFKDDSMTAAQASNILAGTANASATGVEELQYSLAAVSSVASGVGLNFKDTNIALGLFANNGLKGSDAGTSLKTMLMNLSPSTKAQREQFDELGLSAYNVSAGYKYLVDKGITPTSRSVEGIQAGLKMLAQQEAGSAASKSDLAKAYQQVTQASGLNSSAFYDEEGSLKSMSDIAGKLRESMKGLNDEQRQNALRTMFGSDAIRAGNILYKEGKDGFKKFQQEMSKVTALEVAKKKMDNAAGAIEQFKGAMETLQIAVLTPTLPIIKKVAMAAANLVGNFNESGLGKAQKAFGGFFQGLSSGFRAILPVIQPALSNIVAFVMSIVGQIKTFWMENGAQILQAVHNVFGGIVAVLKFISPAILFIINMIWGNVKGVIQGALNIILGLVKIFAGLFTGNFSSMWLGVKQLFIGAVQFLWNLVNLLFVGKILGGIKALATGAIGRVSGMWASIRGFFSGGVSGAWKQVSSLAPKIQSGFSAAKNVAINLARSMWTGVRAQYDKIVNGAKALPGKMGAGIKSMAGKAVDGVISMGNRLLRNIGKIVNGVIKGLNWAMAKVGIDTVINQWEVPQYAKGTNGHPGGLAILGDGGGPELYRTPNGFTGISPGTDTLMNLPRGTQVIPAKETREVLSSIPAYKNGNVTDALKTGAKWVGNKVVGGANSLVDKTKSGAKNVKNTVFDVFEYISSPGKLMSKLLEKFNVKTPSLPGAFGNIALGSFKMIKEKSTTFLKEKLSDFGGGGDWSGGAAAPSQVKSWVTQALNMTGTPLSWLPPMLVKAQKESGYNPRAINLWDINAKRGIPSKGLFQTIDPTFNAYKMAGMNDIYNPVHNAVAAIRYIKSRYGTVFNTPGIKSMARGGAYKGYYKGGQVDSSQWAWVGENGPELMKMRGGSQVFNNKKSNSILSRLLSFGNSDDQSNQQNNNNNESSDQFVFAPVLHIGSRADRSEIEEMVKELMGDQYELFKQMMKKFKKDEDRLSFNT
ncbi:phage tail tape measure protein [Peribacillus muralis]|uniref:phage tail tape measure protein n=1 Tax=Peribacillus muralis TaxID=264697 RepID=UPI003CFE7C15